MRVLLTTAALAVALAACSTEPAAPTENAVTDNSVVAETAAPTPVVNSDQPARPAGETAKPSSVLALEGLGDLTIGKAVLAGSRWAERGAQASDTCRILSSPDYPGVYAIAEGGKVRRITLGDRSSVKLAEGIHVGSTEADVKKWFPSFRVAPHQYEAAPAKYLTAPNAPSGDSALRFEINAAGKVSLIHVGTMPVLGYVESCA